jgi:hypothetical protein
MARKHRSKAAQEKQAEQVANVVVLQVVPKINVRFVFLVGGTIESNASRVWKKR